MKHQRTIAILTGLVLSVGSIAQGYTRIEWVPGEASITPGESVDLQIVGTFSDPVVGWGIDLMMDHPSVVSLDEIVLGSDWDEVDTEDHDGLAGLRFPTGLTGEVVLATLTFTGLEEGLTSLTLGYDVGAEDEGILLEFGGLEGDVEFVPGAITVVPEPATSFLLCAACASVLLRRRRR